MSTYSSPILEPIQYRSQKQNSKMNISPIQLNHNNQMRTNSSQWLWLIFVYGTLKQNQPNHPVLLDETIGKAFYVCKAQTLDKWPLVIAKDRDNLPLLLRKQNTGNQVSGELYLVDKNMLDFLDLFEDHPKHYTRMVNEVITEDQGHILAWIYFITKFPARYLNQPMYSSYDNYGDHGLRYPVFDLDHIKSWFKKNRKIRSIS